MPTSWCLGSCCPKQTGCTKPQCLATERRATAPSEQRSRVERPLGTASRVWSKRANGSVSRVGGGQQRGKGVDMRRRATITTCVSTSSHTSRVHRWWPREEEPRRARSWGRNADEEGGDDRRGKRPWLCGVRRRAAERLRRPHTYSRFGQWATWDLSRSGLAGGGRRWRNPNSTIYHLPFCPPTTSPPTPSLVGVQLFLLQGLGSR